MNNGLVPQQIQEMIADRLIIMQESNLGWKLDCHSCKPPHLILFLYIFHHLAVKIDTFLYIFLPFKANSW